MGAAGPRAHRRPRRLAGRRPGAAGRVDSVTAVVQVQGKVRARLEVSPDITAADLEALALADAAVVRAIEGREVRRVIVREPTLVNVVV